VRIGQRDKKEKIILSAMMMFAKKGFAKTSMADIARGAGIGKGTTYEYFKSKDDLFFETFQWYLRECEQAAKISLSHIAVKNSEERIRSFSKSILNSLTEAQEIYPLVFEFWAATGSSKYRHEMKTLFKDLYRDLSSVLVDIIHQGVESGEFHSKNSADLFSPAVIGAWDAIGLQKWFNDEFDMEATMNAFTELMISGLKKK